MCRRLRLQGSKRKQAREAAWEQCRSSGSGADMYQASVSVEKKGPASRIRAPPRRRIMNFVAPWTDNMKLHHVDKIRMDEASAWHRSQQLTTHSLAFDDEGRERPRV